MTEPDCAALLDGAASYLATVGLSDPRTASAAIRNRCLRAAELLCRAGAIPTRLPRCSDLRGYICDALTLLSEMPPDYLAEPLLREATAAADEAVAAFEWN
jgi:hypothetical protein